MEDYKEKIAENIADEKKQGKIDYERTAFILKKPYSCRISVGPIKINNRESHKKLLEYAKTKQLYVWYGQIEDNKLCGHMLIDWMSVPEASSNVEPTKSELKCEKCGKICSSKPGLTLHLKVCN